MGRHIRRSVALISLLLLLLLAPGARAQKDPFGAPRNLQIEVRFSAGTVIGRVSDQPVKIGEEWLDLGDIATFNRSARAAPVTLRDGRTINGDFTGVDPIDVTVGEVSFKVDLAKAVGLTITEAKENRPARPDKTARRPAPIQAPAAHGNAPAPLDESLAGEELESTVVALPAPAEDVVPASGGEKLLLWLKKLNKIAVFDVRKAEISGYIPAPADSIAYAGGKDEVLLALNEQSILQRWNLQTLQKERTAPIDQPARSLVMGWASDGPAVMNGRVVVDPVSLKPITVPGKARGHTGIDGKDHQIRASGDGSTLTSWRSHASPSGIYVGRLTRTSLEWKYENNSAGVLLPSPDGSLILTSHGGLYTTDIKPLAGDTFKGVACIPSYHTSYFLGVRRGDNYVDGKRDTKTDVSIYTNSDRRQLLRLQPFPEMQPVQGASAYAHQRTAGVTIDKRYHFVPAIKKLVTLPETNDQLVVRNLDVLDAMDKAGIDYLYVDSIPNRSARNGQLYEYPIAVRAKKGPVKFNLDSGPRGMTVTKDGVIKWQVPKGFFEKQVGVIVTITDSTGQDTMHAFNIDMGFGAPGGGGGIVISPRDP